GLPGGPDGMRLWCEHVRKGGAGTEQVDHSQGTGIRFESERTLTEILVNVRRANYLTIGEYTLDIRTIPGVVSSSDSVGATFEKFIDHFDGHAKPVYGGGPSNRTILSVDHNQVDLELRAELRQPPGQPLGGFGADDVTDKQCLHAGLVVYAAEVGWRR